MRKAVVILAVSGLISGCGGGQEKKPATTATQKAKPATTATQKAKPAAGPQYVPSAHHAHRPRGFIYNDEVGENVLSATYDRIIQVFGPPASIRGKCIRYKIVGDPHSNWEFCFKGQRMTGAGAIPVG